MPASTAVLTEDRLDTLDRDLTATGGVDESGKSVFRQLQHDLQEAYFKIEQQQHKLELLTKKLRSSRGPGEDSAPVETEIAPKISRLADLAHPDNLSRHLTHGHTSKTPRLVPAGAETISQIDGLWQRLPAWTKGTISTEDAGFLAALINEIRPNEVYEVGVASGASSSLILSSMAAYADPSKVWLHSYDIAEACYFDPAHLVGDATRSMVPDLLRNWRLNVRTTALDVPREKNSRALHFIDANHSHPWPTLDLIALLPGLKPGDCVALHDVNLATITDGKFPDYGVEWLFADWLGERMLPDVRVPNIGAIIVPEDKNLVLASIVKSLSREWPTAYPVSSFHLHACEKALREYLS